MNRILIPRALSAAVLVAIAACTLEAQTWNNSGTDWGTAGNWSGGIIPDTNTETATFNSAAANNPALASDQVVKGLTFTNATGNYTFSGPGKLTMDGNSAATITNGTFYNTQTFDINLDITNSGTATNRMVISDTDAGGGTVNFSAGKTVTLLKSTAFQGGGNATAVFNFYGTLALGANNLTHQGALGAGGSSIYFRSGSSVTGTGQISNSAGNIYLETSNLGTGILNQTGSIAQDGGFYISAAGLTITNDLRVASTADGFHRTIGSAIADGGTATYSGAVNVSQNTGTDIVRNVRLHAATGNRLQFTGAITSTSTITDAVQVSGGGTVVLSGNANTYNILTTVAADTILLANNISGSATGAGGLTVSGGLGGTGRISPTGANSINIASGGFVAPGDGGIGSLTLDLSGTTGGVSFASGSGFSFELGAAGATDALLFTGLVLDGGEVAFNNNSIALTSLGGVSAGTYTLFSFDQNGAYTGTLSLGALAGFDADLVYNANNIQLVLTSSVPEPASFAGLAGLGMLGFAATRRRRA